MLRLRNQAESNGKDLANISEGIARSLRTGIWRANQLSRISGYKVGERELVSFDPDYEPSYPNLLEYQINDLRLANRYAGNFAALWLKKAKEHKGSSIREAVRAANRESLHRLKLISATESSKAYSEGKSEACLTYNGSLNLYKKWDSTMDKTHCHSCASNHGITVLISEKFSFGEPGDIHPNCRCTYYIYTDGERKN